MIDRPVLAPCVQRLQADQERSPSIGIKQLLQFSQLLPVVLDFLGRLLVAFVMVLEPRVDIFEMDGGAGRHPEAFDDSSLRTCPIPALSAIDILLRLLHDGLAGETRAGVHRHWSPASDRSSETDNDPPGFAVKHSWGAVNLVAIPVLVKGPQVAPGMIRTDIPLTQPEI